MDEDRNELINTEQLIGRAIDAGADLGSNPHQTINKYIEMGLIPKLINDMHPATAVDRLVAIDTMLKKGKTLEEIKEIIRIERKEFLAQGGNLSNLVAIYKKAAFKSLLMLTSLTVLMIFAYGLFTSKSPTTVAADMAKGAAKPVGRTLAAFIRQAKEDDTSTDPLGLTNISKVININEKQEIVIEKNIVGPTTEIIATNVDADKIDGADAGTEAGNVLLLNEAGDIDISGNVVANRFTGSGTGLIGVPAESISGVLANSNLPSNIDASKILGVATNATLDWGSVTSKPIILSSLDGVGNNLGNIDLVAGAGVTITPNNSANTITFGLAGSGVDADLLDSLDSTAFLRSNTSDSFTSGTLTIGLGTTLSVTGSFSCTNCIGDAAVADTITASNYLLLAGGTMAGTINMNTNLITNIGNAATDFTATGGLNIADGLDVAGHVAIGAGASVQTWGLLEISETISAAGARGIRLTETFNPSSSTTVMSIFNNPTFSPTGGLAHQVYGIHNEFTVGGSATIVAAHGIYIATPTIAGSTVGNLYGLYINNQTGATTANYAIYQAGTTGTNVLTASTNFGRNPTGNDTSYGVVIQGALCVDDSTANCPAGPTAGAIYVENSVGAGNVSAFDISEYYPATEPTEKGDIVSAAGNSLVKKSAGAYDPSIIGIVSTDPAFVIDETNITFGKTAGDKFNPFKPYIALAGRVPVKVSGENGPIAPGDPLTSSSIPGVAMKAIRSGPIIGKALAGYEGSGAGKIVAFVSVGWYVAPFQEARSQNQELSAIDTETLSANTINTQILVIGDRKISMNENGKLEIDGDVEIAGDLLVAGKIAATEIELSDKSSGTKTIAAGGKEIEVETDIVKPKSKIFVTFTSDYAPATRYWVTKTKEEGFTVHLDQAVGKNVDFNWIVIN